MKGCLSPTGSLTGDFDYLKNLKNVYLAPQFFKYLSISNDQFIIKGATDKDSVLVIILANNNKISTLSN